MNFRSRPWRVGGILVLWLAVHSPAEAQFAVIDVGAITQLITEVQTLQTALDTARSQLTQAQEQYVALTGARGMDQLLAGIQRNYLPTTWAELQGAMGPGSGSYPALSASVTATVGSNAILTAAELATLPADVQQSIRQQRAVVALSQGLARQELVNTSARFASLQQLIAALGRAADPKAVLDLQARILTENAMLLNEQSKLQSLQRVTRSEQDASRQQRLERALAGHGEFATRFQPSP
jgi:type IV secretion system protein VirB5